MHFKMKYKYTVDDAIRIAVINKLKPIGALRAYVKPCTRQWLNCLLSNIYHTEKKQSGHDKNSPIDVVLETTFKDEVSSITNSTLEGTTPLSINSYCSMIPQLNTRSSSY